VQLLLHAFRLGALEAPHNRLNYQFLDSYPLFHRHKANFGSDAQNRVFREDFLVQFLLALPPHATQLGAFCAAFAEVSVGDQLEDLFCRAPVSVEGGERGNEKAEEPVHLVLIFDNKVDYAFVLRDDGEALPAEKGEAGELADSHRQEVLAEHPEPGGAAAKGEALNVLHLHARARFRKFERWLTQHLFIVSLLSEFFQFDWIVLKRKLSIVDWLFVCYN
jgi:hypothetical protein